MRSLGTLGPREPSRPDAVDQSAARLDRPRGRGRRAGRPRCLLSGSARRPQSVRRARRPTPSMTFEPANAAADVVPTAPVGVEVRDGWFQRVALTNAEGKVVAGALNRDRTAFTVTEPLGYGVEYTWGGSVVGRDGKAVPVAGRFTTVDPEHPGQRPVPARRRSGRRRRGADHHPVRRVDQRQGGRREGAQGHHRPAGRGQLGVAARRGRWLARALAHPGVLPGGHQGARRREALRRRRSATAPTARRTRR